MSPLNIQDAHALNYGCKKCTQLSQIYFTAEQFYLVTRGMVHKFVPELGLAGGPHQPGEGLQAVGHRLAPNQGDELL